MHAATLFAIIAPVALAASNVTTTIVAPACTDVATAAGAMSTGTGSSGGKNGTVTGSAPSATIVTAGAAQNLASFGFVGAVAGAVAMIL